MTLWALVALAAAVAVVVAFVQRRALRRARAEDPDFGQDWKRVPLRKRSEVALAVVRGRAVSDERDAELAVRFARQLRTLRPMTSRLSRAMQVIDVAIGAAALVIGSYLALTRGLRAALVVAPFALFLLGGLARSRLLGTFEERVERAERANLLLLETHDRGPRGDGRAAAGATEIY